MEGSILNKQMIQILEDINSFYEVSESTKNKMTLLNLQVNEMSIDFQNNLAKWKADFAYLIKEDSREKFVFDKKLDKVNEKIVRSCLISNELLTKSMNHQKEIELILEKFKSPKENSHYSEVFKKIHEDFLKNHGENNIELIKNNLSSTESYNNKWKDLLEMKIMNNKLSIDNEPHEKIENAQEALIDGNKPLLDNKNLIIEKSNNSNPQISNKIDLMDKENIPKVETPIQLNDLIEVNEKTAPIIKGENITTGLIPFKEEHKLETHEIISDLPILKSNTEDKNKNIPQHKVNLNLIEEPTKSLNKIEPESNLINIKPEKTSKLYLNKTLPIKNWNFSLVNSFVLPEKDSYAKCMCMNNELSLLHIGTKIGKIHTFDMNSLEFTFSIQAHTGSVRSLNYLNDGINIISGGVDGKLLKFNFKDQKREEFIRSNPSESIRGIVNIMDGEIIYIVSGSYIETYNIISMREEIKTSMNLNSIVTCILWFKEGCFLVAGLKNGEVVFVNPKTKSIIKEFRNHQAKVTGMTYCRFQGKHAVATCSKDNYINIYGLDEKILLSSIENPIVKDYFPKSILYGYDDKTLFTTHGNGKICTFDYNKKYKKKYNYINKSSITAFIYAGDSSTIVIGNKNSEIDIFTSK